MLVKMTHHKPTPADFDGDAVEVRRWLEEFSAAVRAKDYARGRELFVEEVVAFGTRATMVLDLDSLTREQWRPIWAQHAGFNFISSRRRSTSSRISRGLPCRGCRREATTGRGGTIAAGGRRIFFGVVKADGWPYIRIIPLIRNSNRLAKRRDDFLSRHAPARLHHYGISGHLGARKPRHHPAHFLRPDF